nr:integrase, catalytic region, zinc finger, CCHC-type, peptidase aspartic, catalytic [Tanacetum cinerariifolium]
IKPFDYTKLNSLYDLFVPQREKSSEHRFFLERSRISHINVQNEKKKESFQKQTTFLEKRMDESIPRLNEEMVVDLRYFNSLELEVDSLTSQLETQKTHELKKLIEKLKGKSVDTKFEKSSVIRQPNAFKSQRPSVLEKPITFSNSFIRKDFSKSTSVTQNNESNDFSKPVTAQTLPSSMKSILKNTNVLAPGMYKLHKDHTQARTSQLPQDYKKTNKRVSFSIGVIPITSVSRPQLKSNPQGDRVMHNHTQGKKKEVEDHRRSVKLSKNKTFVTACNDSLNAKTLNVKFVSAMCDKCVLIDKHDMKSTCFIRDLKGNDLLTGSRSTDLYSITHQDTNSPNPICLMAKATSSQAWLWHRLLSHLNFDTINLLSKNDIVIHLDSFLWSKDETPKVLIDFLRLIQRGLQAQVRVVRTDKGTEFLNQTLHAYFAAEGIQHQTSVARTPEQNGVVERRNRTLEKGNECIFVGYSNQSRAYRVFKKRTRVIMESIHVNFDELPQMASDQNSSDPAPECQTMALEHDSLSPGHKCLENVSHGDKTVTTLNELDLLFSPMFDELLNGPSQVVSKSSVVSAADALNQRQQYTTPLNNHTTPAPTC